MTIKRYSKDPDDVLDYHNVFSDPSGLNDGSSDDDGFLQGDTIATSTWIVPDGITKDSEVNTTTTTTVWLSGGTIRKSYTVTNRIVTAAGRTKDKSIIIVVKEQ